MKKIKTFENFLNEGNYSQRTEEVLDKMNDIAKQCNDLYRGPFMFNFDKDNLVLYIRSTFSFTQRNPPIGKETFLNDRQADAANIGNQLGRILSEITEKLEKQGLILDAARITGAGFELIDSDSDDFINGKVMSYISWRYRLLLLNN